MKSISCARAALVLWLTSPEVAASESRLRLLSKDEILANMTMDKAYGKFLALGGHQKLDADAMKVVKSSVDAAQAGQSNLRQIQRHNLQRGQELENTTAKLNDLIYQAGVDLDLTEEECGEKEAELQAELDQWTEELSNINAQVTAKGGEIIGFNTEIHQLTILEDEHTARLAEVKRECEREIKSLKEQYRVAKVNVKNMDKVMKVLDDCPEASATLLQCVNCNGVQQVAMVKDERFQELAKNFEGEGKEVFEKNFIHNTYTPSKHVAKRHQASLLLQVNNLMRSHSLLGVEVAQPMICEENYIAPGDSYRGCQDHTEEGLPCIGWSDPSLSYLSNFTQDAMELYGLGDHNYCRNPDGSGTLWCFTDPTTLARGNCTPRDSMEAPQDEGCVPTNDCKLSKGTCGVVFERLSSVNAELMEERDRLQKELADKQDWCKTEKEDTKAALKDARREKDIKETDLAKATAEKTELTETGAVVTKSRKEVEKRFHKNDKECCDEKNAKRGDHCALLKIRDAVTKKLAELEGHRQELIADCEQSEWIAGACSVSCGGGQQVLTRDVIQEPGPLGAICLGGEKTVKCNQHECPVNCEVDVWSNWQSCTAECGIGTKLRSRRKLVPEKHGGTCEELEQSEDCNVQSCDANCELDVWTKWSACSKACGEGSTSRRRHIKQEARGSGTCPDENEKGGEDPTLSRLEIQTCELRQCGTHSNEVCNSEVDVMIALDASGSIEHYWPKKDGVSPGGWNLEQVFATSLIEQNFGENTSANIAVMSFSGPTNVEEWMLCNYLGNNKACHVPLVANWESTLQEKVDAIKAMEYTGTTTFTHKAMEEANNEFQLSRPGVPSVLLIVTDGKATFPQAVEQIVPKLKANGIKIIFATVGDGLSQEDIATFQSWTTDSWSTDNIFHVQDMAWINTASNRNRLIASICNDLAPVE